MIGVTPGRCYTARAEHVGERAMSTIRTTTAVAMLLLSVSSLGGERGASQEFSRVKSDPVELRRFLYMMPKNFSTIGFIDS